jgi:hypothetical protein
MIFSEFFGFPCHIIPLWLSTLIFYLGGRSSETEPPLIAMNMTHEQYHMMKAYRGVKVQLHIFLNSALDAGE